MFEAVVAGHVAERPDCGHLVAACEVVEAVVRDGRAWRSGAMFGNDWPWWNLESDCLVPRSTHTTVPVGTLQHSATS
jgi:hypothetical protein